MSSRNVDNVEIVFLQEQTPPQQTLILIPYTVEENQRVMVGVNVYGKLRWNNIKLKVL